MTVFYKSGFDRYSVLGNLHYVRGHWVSRDEWGIESRAGISTLEKTNFLISEFRNHRKNSSQTTPSTCPECGASVYFYRNECGGAVWFDELGWPWPKHPCMDIPNSTCSFDYFSRKEAAEKERLRLKKLAEQEKIERKNKKEERRNKTKLWQVYGAARFYRLRYHNYWDPKWYLPSEFKSTPRNLLKKRAELIGNTASLNKRDIYRLSLIAPMYGPRKSKLVADHFGKTEGGLFLFTLEDGTRRYSVPVRILRSTKFHDTHLIAVVSEHFPWVGIWLKSDISLKEHRNLHGLLEWDHNDDGDMLLSFVNIYQKKLNWRTVEVSSIFDGRKVSPIP